MRILALDIATHCGYAISSENGLVSGTWDLSPRKDESKGMKLIRFQNKLISVLMEYEHIDLVAFEAARAHGHMQAIVVQAELQGVLKAFCEDNCIEYVGVSPSEVKKAATGKGNASKELVVVAMRKKYPGQMIVDDNQADALAIHDIAVGRYGG